MSPDESVADESVADESSKEAVQPALTEIELLKKELLEYKDKYLRVLAESENTRKRLQKDKQEMIQYAIQNVIVDFLNPIDHMENALKFTQQMPSEVKNWAVGFQMILAQFQEVLTNNNVTTFVSEGTPFNHNNHEAVETVSTDDFPPGIVIEENVRGYKMGDKTIRPARVKVSKSLATSAEIETTESKLEN